MTNPTSDINLLNQLAEYIATNFLGEADEKVSFPVRVGGTLTVNITDVGPDTQATVLKALEAWSIVSGLHFEQVESDDAHITFIDDNPGAYALVQTSGGVIDSAVVNLDRNWVIFMWNALHEIGHALGLGHAGPYEFPIIYGEDNLFPNDSWQATVMSYFSARDNTDVNGESSFPITPQIADIVAIQLLYGKPEGAFTGDTVYGVGANTGTYLDEFFARSETRGQLITLHDTDGYDTLDFSNAGNFDHHVPNQRVDLNPGAVSDVYTGRGNLIITHDTIIEKFVAGHLDDHITGNFADNTLEGRNGADTIYGMDGNDIIIGGAGGDALYGGDGLDTAVYTDSNAAVNVNLETNMATGGYANGDMLTSIENLIGSSYSDTLVGDTHANHLEGRNGNDVLEGGAGTDRLDGGEGLDTASYTGSNAAVTINLETNTVSGGHAEGDMLISIENLIGSAHVDTLIGDNLNNILEGGAGADRLDGRNGQDTAAYTASDSAVIINLEMNTTTGGHAEGDTLTSFENLIGSTHDDTLVGAANDNIIEGWVGADRLDGGAGLDTATYTGSDAAVTVNLETNTATGGHAEGDTLANIENLTGSPYHDTLTGDTHNNRLDGGDGNDTLEGGVGVDRLEGGDGNDTLEGGAGADRLEGGAGLDWLSYAGSDGAVSARLYDGLAQRGHAEGDTISGFENLRGSAYADRLAGTGRDNRLAGGAGNDQLWGGSGDDVLDGGAGNDQLRGGSGDDVLDGGAGADRFYGNHGQDTADYSDSTAGVTVRLHSLTARGGDADGDTFGTLLSVDYTDADGNEQIDSLPDIERLTGSNHDDILAGDRRDNVLDGGGGDDALYGGPGGGDDQLRGGTGNDGLWGGVGNDVLEGDVGADRLYGGAGTDWVDYSQSSAGVTINLEAGTGIGGDAEGDVIVDVERIVGSPYDDMLIGDDKDNWLEGSNGDDVLEGGAGADRLDGGAGTDWVDYSQSSAAVTVDLEAGMGIGGDAEGDILVNINHIYGSEFGDKLVGNEYRNSILGGGGDDEIWGGYNGDFLEGGAGADQLYGGNGNDSLHGGEGNDILEGGEHHDNLYGGPGADHLDGGAGTDWLAYSHSSAAVIVNLETGTGAGGDAEGDVLVNIERVSGSPHDDRLTGDDKDNVLEGHGGDDWLKGGPGADIFNFYHENGDDIIADFELGIDLINLRFFYLDDIEELHFTTDDNGVTIDLTDIGGGTILLADLTTPLDTNDFVL